MELVIKNALPSDWLAVQKLNSEVFENDRNHDKYINYDWPFSKDGQKYFQSICSDPSKYLTLIAWIDQIPIGYLTASKRDFNYRTNNPLEINNMGVSPSHRSQGIGKALVAHAKKWAKENGFTHLYVEAYAQNTKAHQFYNKMGLEPTAISFEGEV